MTNEDGNAFKKRPLIMYFVFSFVFTWIILSPGVAATAGFIELGIDGTVLTILGGFGPLLSAILVTGIISGRSGVRKIFTAMFNWKVGFTWWAASVVLLAGLFLIAAFMMKLMGQGFPTAESGVFLNGGNIAVVVLLLLAGSFGEEPGWRGFALPRLQAKRKPIIAALILTVFWWLWHIPTYWVMPMAMESVNQVGFIGAFGMQFIVLLMLTLLCSWVFNGSKGSVLMPVLLHAGWNFWVGAFGQEVSMFLLLLLVVSTIVVGFVSKWKFAYHGGTK